MTRLRSTAQLMQLSAKIIAIAYVSYEIVALALVTPILYAILHRMYPTAGIVIAIWLGVCIVAGGALAIYIPMVMGSKIKRFFNSKGTQCE